MKKKKKWKGENGVSGKKRGKINSFYFHFASPGGGGGGGFGKNAR